MIVIIACHDQIAVLVWAGSSRRPLVAYWGNVVPVAPECVSNRVSE